MKKQTVLALLATVVCVAFSLPIQAAEDGLNAPRLGITLKTDAVNFGGQAGLKVLALDNIALEGYYIGVGGDFTGYAVRGMYLFPTSWVLGDTRVRPYAGLGYATLEEEVEYRGGTYVFSYGSFQGGVTGGGSATCKGSGAQLLVGIQANPFKSIPNLFLEVELNYSLFEVEGEATVAYQGTGDFAPYSSTTSVEVESDYNSLGVVFGLTYYF